MPLPSLLCFTLLSLRLLEPNSGCGCVPFSLHTVLLSGDRGLYPLIGLYSGTPDRNRRGDFHADYILSLQLQSPTAFPLRFLWCAF